MGVKCQIFLQKAKDGVFRPGQAVIGTLNYFIDKPTKFGSIDISFVGKGKCQWTESDSDNETITYRNDEEFVNINMNIFSDVNDKSVLVSGNFEVPFEFLLPDDIPASFKNSTCTIEYKVIATFLKHTRIFDTRKIFDAEVPVYGYVNPCSLEPLVFGLQKNFFSLANTNNFTVKAEIDKTFVTPGESFTLMLTAENNSDIPVAIKSELIRKFTYKASNRSTKTQMETVDTTKRYSLVLQEKTVMKLTLIVPTLPSLYSIQHTKILTGEYKVRVTAKVPFPHINAMAEVPVVIGEKKDHLGVATLGIQEDPPSYTALFPSSSSYQP